MMPKTYILTPDGDIREENELRHYGIPGMKWGIRRYQNEDGTLTTAGRARRDYGEEASELGSYVTAGRDYVGRFLDVETKDFSSRFSLDTRISQHQDRLRSNGDTIKPGMFAMRPNGQRAAYFDTNTWFKMKYDDLAKLYADEED